MDGAEHAAKLRDCLEHAPAHIDSALLLDKLDRLDALDAREVQSLIASIS